MRARRLRPLLEIARTKERDAAKALADSLKQKGLEQMRLSELSDYLGEYENAKRTGSAGSIAWLQNQNVFLERLRQAVRQQEMRLSHFDAEVSEQVQRWQQANAYHRQLEKLLDRYKQDEAAVYERRLQKETDEAAQRCGKTQVA